MSFDTQVEVLTAESEPRGTDRVLQYQSVNDSQQAVADVNDPSNSANDVGCASILDGPQPNNLEFTQVGPNIAKFLRDE